ncbi:Uncharacterized protein YR821_3164 [Yersinia ruckeri]|uniref:Uncharacterized protein n=1 Tax=Yersinia ruckeri TaxID=29486 RepID=A0A0A8VHC2_YERRU|nr:hypothetical protein yruck0001_2560 [Yersinia ruckeri ATCC 29473]QTD78080.1 Uncharacterized protein YR821_3164 [Yersinia ruckeri]CEK28995.1 hypothetical protein CSF007_16365 [Yersinia ruckeri]
MLSLTLTAESATIVTSLSIEMKKLHCATVDSRPRTRYS